MHSLQYELTALAWTLGIEVIFVGCLVASILLYERREVIRSWFTQRRFTAMAEQ